MIYIIKKHMIPLCTLIRKYSSITPIGSTKDVILVRKVWVNNLTEICTSISYEVTNHGIATRIMLPYLINECDCESCLYSSSIALSIREEMKKPDKFKRVSYKETQQCRKLKEFKEEEP
jgi:hypothetical protein